MSPPPEAEEPEAGELTAALLIVRMGVLSLAAAVRPKSVRDEGWAAQASAHVDITGEQHTIGEIFSDRFYFAVPPYQRQYAWKVEQVAELLADVCESMGTDERPVEEKDPYFLGSIVLVRGEREEHEIVDGQQRLITFTIVLAVLRELLPSEYSDSITSRLYEPPDHLSGTPGRFRLRPKQNDADFFRAYIQTEGGIARLLEHPHAELSEGQQNMLDNVRFASEFLAARPNEVRIQFAKYLLGRCLMVVISAPKLASAYRLFSVLNNRGVDLSDADVLKADIIGPISLSDQAEYTERWERLEEALGTEGMVELLSHLRVLITRGRASDRLADFRTHVLPRYADRRVLVNQVIVPYGAAFSLLMNPEQDGSQSSLTDEAKETLYWLRQINNHDWVAPALQYLAQYHRDPARVARFLCELERLAAYLFVCQQYGHRRQPRYLQVIAAVEQGRDLRDRGSPIQLTKSERDTFVSTLEGDMYLLQPSPRNYVLRRLDSWLAESAARYDQRKFTVEHVLPRNPEPASEWMSAFPIAQVRARWLHRLGNLALLTRDKNENASNYDFVTKKQVYFASRGGVTPYAITTQVLREETWTPEVVERRQRQLIDLLREKWKL